MLPISNPNLARANRGTLPPPMITCRLVTMLLAGSMTGALACVPDYSPDPMRPVSPGDAGDSGRRDARTDTARDGAQGEPDPTEMAPEDGSEPVPMADGSVPTPVDGCDLTGRWLVNEHLVTNGLGARQVVSTWYLYELTQTGSELVVDKGLACGSAVRGLPPVEATGDMNKVFPAMLEKVSHGGRRGRSVKTDDGCMVSFDEHYIAYGASLPFYLDPAEALPSTDQPASAAEPGWEDWEGDGHPGYTVRMTGAVTGSLYLASRTRTVYQGPVLAGARSFVLPVDWDQIKNTLGLDGSPLLDLPGVRDSDMSQHFVELARLANNQATGDESEQCAAVRKLVPMLTPTATP
jgi:hypothetical protein